ncbi:uncharacterized protein si:ch211-244b2.3 isoform X2 [Pungitius pungitius]|uniref:uncharacterized protein si:ch211-244b2.3 isoform X2 n=1 Tax=Pungitius pungitius TaxID=134920 RepID=UPI002E0FDC44
MGLNFFFFKLDQFDAHLTHYNSCHSMEEQTSCGQETPVNGKHYEWQLSDGHQWRPIDHDHVIETHYCQPGAKGITINLIHTQVFIDFDELQTQTPGVRVQRLSLLPRGHAEDVGWYFRDDQLWREYGSRQTPGTPSSVSSGEVERRFALNPRGTFSFTVGSASYSLDFSAMAQTNCITGLRRNVRRRPKFTSNAGSSNSTSASSPQLTEGGHTWEFMADEGKWAEYDANECALDSAAIERRYQLNPQGRLHFNTERHSYTLSFAGMHQVNDSLGTARAVRRTADGSGTPPRWQFQDVGGIWRDYSKGRSISSQDLELQYQQNPSGTVNFATRNFRYELNFSAMSQKNLSTSTTRSVRRLTQWRREVGGQC